MQKYLKYSLIALILIFAGLSVMAILTNSFEILQQTNPYFFIVSALFFIFSIVFWLISWSILIKKEAKVSTLQVIILGFSCVYGALTPIQVGAEALRSIKAKDYFNIPYSRSVSASLFVKGLKFFLIFAFAAIILAIILVTVELSIVMLFGLVSGFIIILLATAAFLLPLNKKIGKKISRIFHHIGKRFPKARKLEKFFIDYSEYLRKVNKKTFVIVFFFVIVSFVCELLALQYAFFSLGVGIELMPLLVLFIIISVLERTPVLPRGIGLVEAAGFVFLSMPTFSQVSLEVSQVGAILIVFAVIRLVVPTVVSMLSSLIKVKV